MTATPFDLAWMQPKVRDYLLERGRPPSIASTELVSWIDACTDRPRILPARFPICLAWSLQACGYRRRSHRGKVWDRIDPVPVTRQAMGGTICGV